MQKKIRKILILSWVNEKVAGCLLGCGENLLGVRKVSDELNFQSNKAEVGLNLTTYERIESID